MESMDVANVILDFIVHSKTLCVNLGHHSIMNNGPPQACNVNPICMALNSNNITYINVMQILCIIIMPSGSRRC